MKRILLFVAVVTLFISSCSKGKDITGPTPEVYGISPSVGSISTEIKIEGIDFQDGAKVYIDGIESPEVIFVSDTVIFAQIPSGIDANTALDVLVKNPGGRNFTIEGVFTAVPPVLSYVNSATKPSGVVGSTLILEGAAFGSIQGESKIYFSDGAGGQIETIIDSSADWTNEFIITTVPSGAADGPIYLETELGKSNEVEFILAQSTTFSPSVINWSATTSLPTAVSGHNAVFFQVSDTSSNSEKNIVYITGGENDSLNYIDQVIYGIIDETGNIASWDSTNLLTTGLAYHKVIAATPFNSKVEGDGYLYAMGGINSGGTVEKTISVAKINNDGSINQWMKSEISLPEALHSFGATLFRGAIYISGGATNDNTPVNKVYRSEIDSVGALGAWKELASLPNAVSYHGFLNFGAYLYVAGGEIEASSPVENTANTNTGDVYYARIDLRTGDLTEDNWVLNSSALQKSRSKHSTLAVGGNFFVSSGVYSAAAQGSSENIYAQIASDGTIGSFGGATGSNTIESQGGINLFNQASISYVDVDGVVHVMILGGDDVKTPGTKTTNVLVF